LLLPIIGLKAPLESLLHDFYDGAFAARMISDQASVALAGQLVKIHLVHQLVFVEGAASNQYV